MGRSWGGSPLVDTFRSLGIDATGRNPDIAEGVSPVLIVGNAQNAIFPASHAFAHYGSGAAGGIFTYGTFQLVVRVPTIVTHFHMEGGAPTVVRAKVSAGSQPIATFAEVTSCALRSTIGEQLGKERRNALWEGLDTSQVAAPYLKLLDFGGWQPPPATPFPMAAGTILTVQVETDNTAIEYWIGWEEQLSERVLPDV